ncbi:hypothetical protein Tco_0286393, partial [Tanacetum coccineum]
NAATGNYHQILPIIAEKVHQEKVHQEKLKAVKAHLNFEEASQHSESGTPIRRRGSESAFEPVVHADPEDLSQDVAAPSHLRKRVQKRKRCLKGWKRACSTGSEIRGRVYPCTQTIQGVSHTTVAEVTLKAATKVLIQEQRNPLPRDIITKWHPREDE